MHLKKFLSKLGTKMITQFNFERSYFENFVLDFLFVLKPIQGSLEELRGTF